MNIYMPNTVCSQKHACSFKFMNMTPAFKNRSRNGKKSLLAY